MKTSRLTEHAHRRKQQRGISDLQVELIHAFGEDHYQKGGATLSYVSEKRLAQLRQAVDRLSGILLVKAPSETVITMMHVVRRMERTEYVA
jgi:hypothetical protein